MTTETLALALAIASALVVIVFTAPLVVAKRKSKGEPAAAEANLARRLDDLQTALSGREGALGAQVAQLDSKLAFLQESVAGREAALDEQVRGIGAQMQGITALFANDRARGSWAEIGMKRVFEQGGLVEGRIIPTFLKKYKNMTPLEISFTTFKKMP